MNMIPPPLPPYSYRLKKKNYQHITTLFFFSHASNCQFANFLFFKSNKYINYFHVSLSSPPLHHALFFFICLFSLFFYGGADKSYYKKVIDNYWTLENACEFDKVVCF